MAEPRWICVFCGSSPGRGDRYGDAAAELGGLMAERGIGVVYGGASVGTMGVVADAALAAGGQVVGVIPRQLVDREVAHDGINCAVARPDPDAVLSVPSGRRLSRDDEVVTFVARNLEPVRGYHIFMRMLPGILDRRPNAEVVIIGGDGTSYGAAAPADTTWKSIFLKEVESRIDPRRVHFLGQVSYETYLRTLQVSTAHVYLTYPFVLSWSMLEAMSVGCVVIGSDTPPVREVIDGTNGILVPFFDIEQWSDRITDVLANRGPYRPMRESARQFVMANFDASTICVPRLTKLLQFESGVPATRPKEATAPKTSALKRPKTELPPNEWAPVNKAESRAVSRS